MDSEIHRDCGRRVLCVDDDVETRALLTFLLEHAGYQVIVVGTLTEAVALAKQGGLALIILDNWLPATIGDPTVRPGLGIELCKIIRDFDPNTPILFYSAAAFPVDTQMALAAGANGYAPKPFDPNDLLKVIGDLVNRPEASGRASGQHYQSFSP
jgi:two-component system OmpR family response regulator